MNKSIESVKEFHSIFSQPIKTSIGVPSKERALLRVRLIFEELKELAEASGVAEEFNDMISDNVEVFIPVINKEPNNAEALDALVDLQYVLDGSILEYGMQDVFEVAHNDVHVSNMSKFCVSKIDLEASLAHYKAKRIQTYTKEDNGRYFIYKAEDGKLLKPLNYVAADMKSVIKRFYMMKEFHHTHFIEKNQFRP